MIEKTNITTGNIICVGRGGARKTFFFEAYRDEIERDAFHFDVWSSPRPRPDHSPPAHSHTMLQPFHLHLVPLQDGRLRVASIHDNYQEWATGRGIGPAILIRAMQVTGKTIVSSVSEDPDTEEGRTPDADRMWAGMEKRGQARRLENEDRFQVVY